MASDAETFLSLADARSMPARNSKTDLERYEHSGEQNH